MIFWIEYNYISFLFGFFNYVIEDYKLWILGIFVRMILYFELKKFMLLIYF